MSPWRKQNELIYIDPNWQPDIGDHALIKIHHPTDANSAHDVILVRRIMEWGRDKVRLRAYARDEDEEFRADELLKLSRVLEWSELAEAR